jgi:hypothetical protein
MVDAQKISSLAEQQECNKNSRLTLMMLFD